MKHLPCFWKLSSAMQDVTQLPLFRQQAYIAGQWINAPSATTFDVFDPATGQRLGCVPDLGASETMRAIAAAEAALPSWRAKLAKERAAILREWFRLIMESADELAAIMTAEQGKPLFEARGEIGYAAAFVEWFAEEARRIDGDVIPTPSADRRLLVLKQPVGVCAAITPWNFPSAMITRKVAPALAAGCTMVVKPAEQTPFSALALAELGRRAGIPPGVLNVVTGDAQVIGGVLTASPTVRKLSFTGSTEVGRLLMAQCAPTVKKLSLELGGNAPFIVFDDADLDLAVKGAISSKFRNTGQTCVCANRLYVQAGVYDVFARRLAEAVAKLRVGPGTAGTVHIGPLIDDAAVEKVESHVSDALAKGAQTLLGGKRHALGGSFFEPTVLTGVTPAMHVAREETFGPVAPLFRFESEEEVLRMANDTEYGLAAYFFTRDVGRVFRVAEALEFGIVSANTGVFSSAVFPFGGIKQSGFGREGARAGIEEYLEMKSLCIGGVDR